MAPEKQTSERIRLTFDVPDRIRRALNIYASRMGLTVGEVIEELVVSSFPEDVSLADRSIAAGEKARRGRKPKSSE